MCALAVAFVLISAASPEPRVCPDPDRPCPGFKAHDLSFRLPEGGPAREEVRSAPFYAVVLRTRPRCALGEAERLEVQALYPRQKVFATRFECEGDVENNVTYTNVNDTVSFLAVYAGEDEDAAQRLAEQARARFPGANVRRMQVVFIYP
jgi:hypothetical protein